MKIPFVFQPYETLAEKEECLAHEEMEEEEGKEEEGHEMEKKKKKKKVKRLWKAPNILPVHPTKSFSKTKR